MTLQRGRDFTLRDRPDTPATVIINESFAKLYFPGEDPVGHKLITGMGQKISEIVGVVGDTHTLNLNTPPRAGIFPAGSPAARDVHDHRHSHRGRSWRASRISVRAALRDVDADQPLVNPQAYTTLIAQSVANQRLVMLLLAAFAGLALVLACIGVYSVMAYVVSQRTGEIGIRMALGASPGAVRQMILTQCMRLTLFGVGLGGLVVALSPHPAHATAALRRARPADPLIYGGISLAPLRRRRVRLLAARAPGHARGPHHRTAGRMRNHRQSLIF